MLTGYANVIFRAVILLILWRILKSVDPDLATIPLWVNIVIGFALGYIASLSNIGEK